MVTRCPGPGGIQSPATEGAHGGACVGGQALGGRVYLQWCARSGLMLQHLGHLYTTCPGFSCKLSMNSLVAFPLGTAPCKRGKVSRLGSGSRQL